MKTKFGLVGTPSILMQRPAKMHPDTTAYYSSPVKKKLTKFYHLCWLLCRNFIFIVSCEIVTPKKTFHLYIVCANNQKH